MFADRVFVAVFGILATLCVWLWVTTPEPAPEIPPLIQAAVEMGYFPCEREDSPGPCYWNAQLQGNEQGTSFVVTDDGEVFYE